MQQRPFLLAPYWWAGCAPVTVLDLTARGATLDNRHTRYSLAPTDTVWRPQAPESVGPPLGAQDVHVWRVSLDRIEETAGGVAAAFEAVLSSDERARADRFHFARDRDLYVASHGALRRILAACTGIPARALQFTSGAAGKPILVQPATAHTDSPVHFNLSHSGRFALIAVTRGGPVGVDIELWNPDIEHLSLARDFFSPAERESLQSLANDPAAVNEGFFNAWSRKEAYLKALGTGITEGLHHFDVSLAPGQPAALLRDRTNADATAQWTLSNLDVWPGYSAALVTTAGPVACHFFDFSTR